MFEIFIGRIGKVVLLMLVFWVVNLPAQIIGTLTPQSPKLGKTVNFSTPKKIRFKWHEKVVCDQSQYSWASGYYGCAVRLDESEADLNEANWQYDLGYWEDQFNQESVVEADVYVPAGQHTIRWVMFEHELWGNTTSVEVKIEDYAEEEIVMQESLYDWCKVFSEEEVWLSGNLSYLYDKYSSQLNSNGNAYEVRVNRALVSLLRLVENKAVRNVIGEFGFSISDFYLFAFSGEYSGHDKAPLPPEVLNTVAPEVLAAIDAALADFNAIPESWTGSIELKPAEYPALTESVFIDKAEIAAVKAVLKMMRGFVLFIQGYDCTADYAVIENAWRDNATIENILANMPKAGYVRDMTKLADAKEEFRASLQYLKKVDSAIMNRTDTRTHFLEYDEADARDIQEMRTFIDKAITSLDSETEFDFTYAATQSPLNSSPLVGNEIPNGLVRKIYLGALFSGSLTKDLLPSFEYGGEHGDEGFADFYLDTVPDWTFGGVLPDFTFAEVCEMSENHDWTAVGYIRNNPKMILEEGRRLNIVGKATRDGSIEFIPEVDGWCAIFIDGYWESDFDCLSGELCAYDGIEKGSRYSIEFFPAEPVLSPIKPLSLISIPESLPDGGPYVEIVAGIEWVFMIENGVAVIGDGYDSAIPSDTLGAIEIPSSLGGKPVGVIGEAAFISCSQLTSIVIPSSVTNICTEAFYRANNLNSITFLGDEPLEIGVNAFAKIAASCQVKVTRAAKWNVTIPGTWQGLSIGYVAGYDPSMVVSANKTSGNFSVSVSLVLSIENGKTIYYTLDGSEPTQESCIYSSAIILSKTTDVKFFAVDNQTKDWGPISSVRLIRVPCESKDIVVTPNVVDGTRFVDSQVVSFDVEEDKTVYFTTDGSDPMTSSTRQLYSMPIVMTDTTTLKYYAVDDVYGDWSVVQTAHYILRRSDGGPYTEIVEGVEWRYKISDGEAVIFNEGDYWDNVAAIPTDTAGEIEIPSSLGGCPVTVIGESAFAICESLTGVKIPSSIKVIKNNAFFGCSLLSSIKIPSSVISVEEYAFCDCGSLKSVRIGDGLINISASAFDNSDGLKEIYYEGDAPSVDGVFFEDVFATVYVRKGTIGWGSVPGVWYGCQIRYVEDSVFSENVDGMFWNYRNENGDLVLQCSSNLNVADFASGVLIIPNEIAGKPIRVLGKGLFCGASKVTAVTVPSTVTVIEESAFRECSRLETVTLPEGLTTIADNAFRECVSLRSVTIPSTVTNIGYFAFRDCLRLEEVNLLGNPPHRELGVFMGVPAFTTISGRLGSVTAIVYASVTNSTPEIIVPEGWLDEIALKHNKPAGSISYQAAFIEKFGDDLSAALLKPTGKKDLHGNTLLVWQDYVAGTDPLDEEDKFVATVSMESGVPVVRWSPELTPADAALRKYTVYGATALDENWVDVSALSDIERHRAGYQFFKVTVEMR